MRKNNTRLYLIALTLFLAGMGFLVYTGLDKGSSYHLDVAETLTMPAEELRSVRVFGTVSPDGLRRDADALGVRFFLMDQHSPATVLEVHYQGAVPDNFKPGTELYAEGGYDPAARLFLARALTTTCPSKYKKENRG